MPQRIRSHLPRLDPAYYQGPAIVHWTHCIENRRTVAWNDSLHLQFRESLFHSLHRYQLACSAYVLMPDHMHLMVLGLAETSDQLRFNRFFRKTLNGILKPVTLQEQGHDNVLRDKDRERGALESANFYVFENPVRASIVANWKEYPFSGSCFPGYPDMDPKDEDFWDRFWKAYAKSVV